MPNVFVPPWWLFFTIFWRTYEEEEKKTLNKCLRTILSYRWTIADGNEEREVRVHQSDGHHVCFSIIDLWLVLYISPHRVIAKSGEKRTNSLRKQASLKLGKFSWGYSNLLRSKTITNGIPWIFLSICHIRLYLSRVTSKVGDKHLSSCKFHWSSLIILHPYS